MSATFFDGHDELYYHAKFGEDRTTRASCRCENVVFVGFFLSLRGRRAVRSRVIYFEQVFCRRLWVVSKALVSTYFCC